MEGYIDATKADTGLWGGTGSAFAGTKCDINGTRCTWDELRPTAANNNGTPAKITYSVGVTKGRDFSLAGRRSTASASTTRCSTSRRPLRRG